MSNELTIRDQSTEIAEDDFFTPASIFDVERFEQVMRVATVMARATTIPEHLKGKSQDSEERFEETRGNCFMICNQAAHWGMDPFAVAQASAFVFGKIVLEGKLVRAVINKKLGFNLHYRFFGDRGKMDRRVYVSARPLVDADDNLLSEDEIKELMERTDSQIVSGTLQMWHTKNKNGGINDNWVKDEDKMFRERGAREWCRAHKPGLLLGVYTPDEFDEIEHTSRSSRARDITPYNPLLESGGQQPMERVGTRSGEEIEAQRKVAGNKTPPARRDDESTASAKPASTDAGRGGSGSAKDGRPTNSNASSQTDPHGDGAQAGKRDQVPTARLSAAHLRDYTDSLGRMTSPENVEKASVKFWEKAGITPEKGAAHHDLAVSIYKRQMARARGEIDAEGLREKILADIDKAFGDETFPGDL